MRTISKTEILKVVSHLKKRVRGIPDHRIMHPVRDWTIGLAVTTIIFICSTLYAGYAFLVRSKAVDDEIRIESTVIVYKRDAAQEVMEEFSDRVSNFEALRSDRSNVVKLPALILPETTEEETETDTLAEQPVEQ